ncbi:tRNA dimethylallyltransferase 2 [Emticicia aquatilis]|uniref:tRNA dimethylallyltransferase n=1 Tax=Emticicia aquatilis TaxID=1537369 RepID=A0A916YHP5_9BACT|nr:tRNA (adenosine(37)-N6)-dimethylallyltransferase MiaA [Emticicia aquatilis]GGD46033.1 tRNA dimethylallyltransferase 2 [Emticicia aquatilis]
MIEKKDIPLVVILGPTASGKTKLAVNVVSKLNGEIISADSRQVYKGMNIGTGKDYEDYLPVFKPNQDWPAGIEGVHLIDIIDAGDSYNVAFFQRDFQKVYQDIISRNKTPILCGGTGMYIEAVLRNYEDTQVPISQGFRDELSLKNDEELEAIFQEKYFQENADISTRKRLIRAIEIGKWKSENWDLKEENRNRTAEYSELKTQNSAFRTQNFGITIPVEIRRERITKRLHDRLQNGMIEEVKTLLESGISAEKLIFYGLEYKFITEYLVGDLSYDEMAKRLEIAIHQFAKRQMTFFRSMERKGIKINWLDGMQPVEEMASQLLEILNH